jgi:hypothetical protein
LLNCDHLLAARHCLSLHSLLGAGLKISCALSFRAHALDCIHHVRLLCQECVSQIRRPLDIARHALYYVWKLYQSLDAWVPRLFCHRFRQRLPL